MPEINYHNHNYSNKIEGKIKKSSSKTWAKRIFLFFLLLIILVGSVLAYKTIFLTHNLLNKGISSTLSLSKLGGTKLQGEEEGRINFLLLGIGVEGHMGADLTDTIMVASFDLKEGNVSLISIPRDLYIKVPDIGYEKINAVYTSGNQEGYPGGGGALMKKTIGDILGLPIHYYVVIDFDGFKEIVNILGGIDIKVEKDIYDYEYPSPDERGVSPFILKKGDYHMDGDLALKYARSRKSTSDFDRARRQQQVLLAIKEKAFEKKIITNPKKVYEIFSALEKNIKTDLQLPEIAHGVELAQKFQLKNINNLVLDDSADGFLYADNVNGAYVLKPYNNSFAQIQKYVNYFVFRQPQIIKENATIEVLNGAGWEDLANDVANKLKKYKLNIINVGSADRYDYYNTIIYDRTGDKKLYTVSFLNNYFQASVVEEKKSQNDQPDITIIVGRDYNYYEN